MNARQTVQLTYETLGEGQTLAGELCPACSGGESREATLSVSRRDGLLLWNCHRASCGFRGASTGGRYERRSAPVVQTRGTVGRQMVRESEPVPAEASEYLRNRYRITARHAAKYDLGWYEGRLSVPVRNYQGEILGVNLRSLSGEVPKSKLHSEKGALSWFVNHTSPDIIIVEDQFSAMRASDYSTSVALLGTNLNEERVSEIKQVARGTVYLALDADAWDKAVKYVLQYRSWLPLRLLKLTKDIKDMTDEELASFMSANVSS